MAQSSLSRALENLGHVGSSQQHGGGVWISGHYSALTSSLSVKFPVLIKSGSGEEQGGTVGIFISMIC